MKFLVIDDNQEIFDAVSLCLNLRWPQAELINVAEGLIETIAPEWGEDSVEEERRVIAKARTLLDTYRRR